ncbi:MAG TPA: protease pro-enzyme activation domain-containing protein [Chloroflexota bacterium]|nr:protease pro-enzyme activation domain-containing protein [Chloroflexota bacterium]
MNARLRRLIPPRITRLGIGVLLVVSGAIPASGIVAASSPPPVTLHGHVLKNLSSMTRLAAVPPDRSLTLTIALRPSAPTALQNAAVQASSAQRGSHPWLTPRDVGRMFGQSQANVDALAAYFSSYGLTASAPVPNHLSFQVHGTAAQIQQALSVSLSDYQDSHGHRFYATSQDP